MGRVDTNATQYHQGLQLQEAPETIVPPREEIPPPASSSVYYNNNNSQYPPPQSTTATEHNNVVINNVNSNNPWSSVLPTVTTTATHHQEEEEKESPKSASSSDEEEEEDAIKPPKPQQSFFPPTKGVEYESNPQAFPPFRPQEEYEQTQAFPPPQQSSTAVHQFPPPPQQTEHVVHQFPPPQQISNTDHMVHQFPPPQQSNMVHQFPPPQQGPAPFAPQSALPTQPQINAFSQNYGVMGQPANPMMMRPNMTPQIQIQPWSSSLFDCMNDPQNAIITACFPCVTFGQIAEIVDSGSTSCGTSGILYSFIAFCIAMPCILSCGYRTKLRSRYGLIESPAPDWIVHCFCEWCALCQEYRELQARGLDPAIGWVGNMAKQMQQQQQARMTPPMPQRMM